MMADSLTNEQNAQAYISLAVRVGSVAVTIDKPVYVKRTGQEHPAISLTGTLVNNPPQVKDG